MEIWQIIYGEIKPNSPSEYYGLKIPSCTIVFILPEIIGNFTYYMTGRKSLKTRSCPTIQINCWYGHCNNCFYSESGSASILNKKDGIINTYMYSMLFKIYTQYLSMSMYFLSTVEWYWILKKQYSCFSKDRMLRHTSWLRNSGD